jgi:hypothetical protein
MKSHERCYESGKAWSRHKLGNAGAVVNCPSCDRPVKLARGLSNPTLFVRVPMHKSKSV